MHRLRLEQRKDAPALGIGTPYDPETEQGVVGRNFSYQTISSVGAFLDESIRLNSFMGSGASGTVIDDFNVDNFDHSGLGFIGGAYILGGSTGAKPIGFHSTPPGTPKCGAGWREAVRKHYNSSTSLTVQGSSVSVRQNYLDLDPTYRDVWGMPLLRITFESPDNDIRMAKFLTQQAEEIARHMGAKQVAGKARTKPFTVTKYQSTHTTGGAVMGVLILRQAWSTAISKAGVCQTFSLWVRPPILRIPPTIQRSR